MLVLANTDTDAILGAALYTKYTIANERREPSTSQRPAQFPAWAFIDDEQTI